MSHRRLAITTAGSICLLMATTSFVLWPRGTTPLTEDEALDAFRDNNTGLTTSPPGASALPPPGVYVFAASGEEEIKLGALPTETRPYPDTVPVSVSHLDRSCFTVTIGLLDQHTEETTYCVSADRALAINSHVKHQQIGALSPIAKMECDPAEVVRTEEGQAPLRCRLTLSGGPARLTARLHGTSRFTHGATVMVAGEWVRAAKVDITYEISGDLTGTWAETLWLRADDWLPLRIEHNLELQGLAALRESFHLELTSLKSTR